MTVALLLVVALAPASTAAARVVAPPGNSEADQYFETVPGSAGPRGPDVDQTPGDAVRAGRLKESTVRSFQSHGATGQAAAAAAAKTAPPSAPDRSSREGSGRPTEAGSPQSSGLGGVFTVVLVAAAAGAAGFAFARRRRPAGR